MFAHITLLSIKWSRWMNVSRDSLGEGVVDVSLVEVVTSDGILVYGGWGMFLSLLCL